MVYTIFLVMVSISCLTALSVNYAFKPWLNRILDHLASESLSQAWKKCLSWSIMLMGLQGGVRLWDLEDFMFSSKHPPFNANPMHWVLEIYRVFIDAAQNCLWVIIFFLLVAFIVEAILSLLHRNTKKKD